MNFSDQVEAILRNDTALDDSQRADLFEAAHVAPTHRELAAALGSTPLSEDTKARLIAAKETEDGRHPVEFALRVMERMDRDALDYAEAHPTVFHALVAHYAGRKS